MKRALIFAGLLILASIAILYLPPEAIKQKDYVLPVSALLFAIGVVFGAIAMFDIVPDPEPKLLPLTPHKPDEKK
jgi:hypothetical protein